MHNCIVDHGVAPNNIRVLNLDAVTWCHDVMASVRSWFSANSGNTNVSANIGNLVQYREHGLAPFIVGLPMIT